MYLKRKGIKLFTILILFILNIIILKYIATQKSDWLHFVYQKSAVNDIWIVNGITNSNDTKYDYFIEIDHHLASKDKMTNNHKNTTPTSIVQDLNKDKDMDHSIFQDQVNIQNNYSDFRWRRFLAYQSGEASRSGPGERGNGVQLLPGEYDQAEIQAESVGFYLVVSEKIAYDRSLKDYRDPRCQNAVYPEDLPTASVIVIFHNEVVSVVIRTIHSIVNRTPPRYLHEIILVDDASDREELKESFENYTSVTWPDELVKFVRLTNRSGLIRTRMAGAEAATGDVVVILDAHMEATTGWLEPLLARIKEDPKVLAVPIVAVINPKTFEVWASSPTGYRAIFAWDMTYTFIERKQEPTVPINVTGTIGCAMAMDRKMFFHMGGLDPGMDVWGGENTEISIRMWMCGGSAQTISCSVIGHLFRLKKPWSSPPGDNYFSRNCQRIAEVWLDEYKKYFYAARPAAKFNTDYGDISERIALRKRLNCHNFKWFLDNVEPRKFVYDVNVTAFGKLKNAASGTCLDWHSREGPAPVGSKPCCETCADQLFSLTWSGYLRGEFNCIFYKNKTEPGGYLWMHERCRETLEDKWRYEKILKQLFHLPSNLCLDIEETDNLKHVKLILTKCSSTLSQQWEWEHYVGDSK